MKKWIYLFLLIPLIGILSCNKHSDPNAQINKEEEAIVSQHKYKEYRCKSGKIDNFTT